MLKLDAFKESYQLLDSSSTGHKADFFNYEFVVDLFDDELRISLYLEASDSHI